MIDDGVSGLLVAPGDAMNLRAGIQRVLDDDDLAARLGSAGAVRVADFRAGTVVPRIEEVYARVGRSVRQEAGR